MAVKIRLSRTGRTNCPFYRIIAIDSRKKRDGASLEILGAYDPVKKELVGFAPERIEDWASKGAIVSDAVKKLQRLHKKSAVAQ